MCAVFLLVLVATSVSANLLFITKLTVNERTVNEIGILFHFEDLDHELLGLSGEEKSRAKSTKAGRGRAWDTCDCENISSIPDNLRARIPLDDFYQKYTHAYGIPIVSSGSPSNESLTRACYVVRFMLADRKDVRDAMYNSYGRVGVVGFREDTLDIPEYSYLPSWWNNRARGLGGTKSTPLTINAEENLLCKNKWSDRWYKEDILVHELAHAIHYVSMKTVDPTFNGRLLAAWKKAKANKLWKRTYAITHHAEYFAEAVQSYFNVQTHQTWADGIHNQIFTRTALSNYDRTLFNLIEEVFLCKQFLVDRCARNNQELAANHELRMDC